MIRAVQDTNIIVSAFFWGGIPRLALEAARLKKFRLLSTETLLEELLDVVSRDKFSERLKQIGESPESILELYRLWSKLLKRFP